MNPEPIIRHVYDIDAFEIIDSFLQKVEEQNFTKNEVASIRESVEMAESMMVDRLSHHYPEIVKARGQRHFVIPSNYNEYNDYLTYKLLIIDVFKISALLTYQSTIFLGNHYAKSNNFVGLIEHNIYERVKKIKFNDIDLRRKEVMEWVDKNRYFDFEDNTEVRAKEEFLITDPKFSHILFENLKMIVPDDFEHELYYLLAQNRVPKSPIPIRSNKNQIAELFKRIKYNGKTSLSNKKLAEVISQVFRSIDKGNKVSKLKESTIYEVMRRPKDEPSQDNILFPSIVKYVLPSERKEYSPPSD